MSYRHNFLVYFYLSKKTRLDFSFKLILKAPNKNCRRQHFNFLLLSFEEMKLDFSCAELRIHLKHQVLFSLKNHEKIFMNVMIGTLRVNPPAKERETGEISCPQLLQT